MKKFIPLLMLLVLAISYISCSDNDNPPEPPPPPPPVEPPVTDDDDLLKTKAIADSSYYYYNKAFLLSGSASKDGLTYYREHQASNHWQYYWQQALIILMVEDRFDFRPDDSLKPLITDLLDAFRQHEKNSKTNELWDWTWNDYNDDLLWAGLAFVRGYQITGEKRFLEQAEWTWNFLYTRGYDSALGGGIWWSVQKREKSGLSNNPAVCMACYLYEATGKDSYLDQAKNIYNWIYRTLRNSDGSIDEKIDANGTRPHGYNVYNQGTFIEAAAALYKTTGQDIYKEDAKKTIEFVMVNHVDNKGIMSSYKLDGTWQSEFARGMAFLLKNDKSLWNHQAVYTKEKRPITYYDWMRLNADAAWNTRDKVNNITGCEWSKTTPTRPPSGETWQAVAMVSAVIMTQVTPETKP